MLGIQNVTMTSGLEERREFRPQATSFPEFNQPLAAPSRNPEEIDLDENEDDDTGSTSAPLNAGHGDEGSIFTPPAQNQGRGSLCSRFVP